MDEQDEKTKKEKTMQNDLIEKVEDRITQIISTDGVIIDNVDYLYKLVDIHKDLKNEHYWKKKEEKYDDEIQRKLWKLRRIRSKNQR